MKLLYGLLLATITYANGQSTTSASQPSVVKQTLEKVMESHANVDESIRSMVIDSIASVVNMQTIKKIHHEHKQEMKKKKGMKKNQQNSKGTKSGKPKSGNGKSEKSKSFDQ